MRIRTTVSGNNISQRDRKMAELSNALAHPLRVALVRYLGDKNCGVGVDNITCNKDLVALFDYSQSTISQHIRILKDCGLFTTESKDKFTYYYLNRELLAEFSNYVQNLCPDNTYGKRVD